MIDCYGDAVYLLLLVVLVSYWWFNSVVRFCASFDLTLTWIYGGLLV